MLIHCQTWKQLGARVGKRQSVTCPNMWSDVVLQAALLTAVSQTLPYVVGAEEAALVLCLQVAHSSPQHHPSCSS